MHMCSEAISNVLAAQIFIPYAGQKFPFRKLHFVEDLWHECDCKLRDDLNHGQKVSFRVKNLKKRRARCRFYRKCFYEDF